MVQIKHHSLNKSSGHMPLRGQGKKIMSTRFSDEMLTHSMLTLVRILIQKQFEEWTIYVVCHSHTHTHTYTPYLKVRQRFVPHSSNNSNSRSRSRIFFQLNKKKLGLSREILSAQIRLIYEFVGVVFFPPKTVHNWKANQSFWSCNISPLILSLNCILSSTYPNNTKSTILLVFFNVQHVNGAHPANSFLLPLCISNAFFFFNTNISLPFFFHIKRDHYSVIWLRYLIEFGHGL